MDYSQSVLLRDEHSERDTHTTQTHMLSVVQALVPSHSKLHDDAERDVYWERVLEAWGVRLGKSSTTRFPGSNPCSIARHDLSKLKRHPYLVAHKSDGVRYLLFLTVRPGTTEDPVALMIDRARNMYEVDVMAPDEYFLRGTLLEGELVWKQPEQHEMIYLVFDALLVAGDSYVRRPFSERLAAASRLTRWSEELAQMSPDDLEVRVQETDGIVLLHFDPRVTMKPKRFVDLKHVTRVWNERGDAAHRIDGLILQRANASYVYGTSGDAIFKWKDQSSVDLAGKGTSLRAADGPLGTTMHDRKIHIETSRVSASGEDDILEYHIEVTRDMVKLFPMRARPDKTVANGLRVVEATVRDVIENIQPYELTGKGGG